MRCSVLVSVAVMAVVAVVGGVGASQRTSLVNQGYEDVVVGLSPLLDETRANDTIKALKVALGEASQALFRATGNRLFFKTVKILVPSTWKSVTVDQPATTENFENSHMRVDVKNPVYGDQVYTVQPGGCGEPGRYIHLTPAYLTYALAETVWGPRGKVLAQAWARLRWGIFDEVGYPKDQQFPLFYTTWDDEQKVVVRPNHCADHEIGGSYVDLITQGSCKYVNGLPDENCRFVPNDQQTATSSLMSFANLDSIDQFCEGYDVAGSRRHNFDAPNRHNLMCSGRSVWQVLSTHKDFLNATKLPAEHPVTPKVVVVQQTPATMALVLDYSGSMGGHKISVLANTAKRWLLHDVADGTFVTIIRFSTSAVVRRRLTEVSNSTRQVLADAITTDTSGSTCIGCGLVTALQEIKDHSNKVILLITDGGENQKPTIAEVMNDVVQSGSRVVTISYGKSAETTLETLAQNTGGKAYIVPDGDDGSFMDDAFQGSLTYQPGQSLTNTDIKIYEWVGVAQDTEISRTFPVDATVGRNLEFRLDADVFISGNPYLVSPSGKTFTDSDFNSDINLWIIKVDVAEAGTWTWTKPVHGSRANFKVTVTAQARDSNTLPIYTESWMNTGADFVDASKQTVIVYARVSQGENPVVGAKVRAYITTPQSTAAAVELDLLDNGQNADVQKGDGIYSRYFTQFDMTGRYAVKAQVWDEGSSFINNGFITSRRRRRRAVHGPFSSLDELVTPEYCCGSVVPFNPETAIPTGNFTRTVAAGSINVVKMPESGDSFPPSRVMNLRIDVNGTSDVMLSWTAPGDDYDTGIVSGYEIWMSGNSSNLDDDLDANNTVTLLDLETSKNMTELLREGGEEITLPLHIETLQADNLYYVALRAVDDAGNKSPISRPVSFVVDISSGGSACISWCLKPWTIVLLVIGRFLGTF